MIFTMHLFKILDSKIINSWLRINHVVNLDGPVFGDLQQTRGKEGSKVAWFNISKTNANAENTKMYGLF